MAGATSANKLPAQTPNTSAPIATVSETEPTGLFDSTGKPITGMLPTLMAYVTPSWRYLFGTFAQTSKAISPTFSLTADKTYSQQQLQQLADQVALLSAQLGRTT